jgi:hypothetical protein
MGKTCLEKQKLINLYSTGKEPNDKKTHRKTKNEMRGCSEEGRRRTRRRK